MLGVNNFFEKKIKNEINTIEELFSIVKGELVDIATVLDFNEKELNLKSDITYLRHITSVKNAISILKNRNIYGEDGDRAHFELLNAFINKPYREGVSLFFTWQGKQKSTGTKYEFNNNIEENMLYHISIYDDSGVEKNLDGYWESRIYPNTNTGLQMIGFSVDKNKLYSFVDSIDITVVSCKTL